MSVNNYNLERRSTDNRLEITPGGSFASSVDYCRAVARTDSDNRAWLDMLGASMGTSVESELERMHVDGVSVDMDLQAFKDAAVPPMTVHELASFQIGFKNFGALAINMINAIDVNELRGAGRV